MWVIFILLFNKVIIRIMLKQWVNLENVKSQPIIKIPFQFHFEPVEILSKQLTRLNSTYPYRIHYLGPRWDDSASLHKKYANRGGYKFNDKQINRNNSFFTESMGNNQFYKNQVYYRAFQGMNPTIDKQQVIFDSRFQSGNLDCVVKVGPQQYDLFLRIDSNTRGQLFWYYFEISNCKPGTVVKLNICNITKSIELYLKGFKPFSSIRNKCGLFQNWTQQSVFDVAVEEKKLRYQFIYEKKKVRRLYELSFKYKFESRQPVRFAYCVPYTYSNMISEIQSLKASYPQHIQIGSIGRSLTGVQIPYIVINQQIQSFSGSSPIIVCIGRLHPAETNGSHVLSGFLKYVITSLEAQYLRKRVQMVFIPMLNPDGVILGNSRTGAMGKDLNRQFKIKNQILFPQIHNLKQFCSIILQNADIELFLDFHGHSKKKNMFFFGPNYNITQSQYYRTRILPKLLSQITSVFRYFGCSYSIPINKSTTARAVMLQQLKIPYVYTIQTSIGQYFDYELHKNVPFSLKKWLELGSQVGRATKRYFQAIEQFSEYVKLKTNNLETEQQNSNKPNNLSKQQKVNEKSSKASPIQIKRPTILQKPKKIALKQMKLIKVIQEIKASQQQRKNFKKKPEQSDNQSDSQNEQDNLQGKMRVQFEQIISQCILTQKIRNQKQTIFSENKLIKIRKQQTTKEQRKKQKSTHKQEMNVLKQFLRKANITNNFNQTDMLLKTIRNSKSKQQNLDANKYDKVSLMTIGGSKTQRLQYENSLNNNTYTQTSYYQAPVSLNQNEKFHKNNINLKMFNFSNITQTNISQKATTITVRENKNRFKPNIKELNTSSYDKYKKTQQIDKGQLGQYFNNTALETNRISKLRNYQDLPLHQSKQQSSSKKMKGLFPAHFYRIKYHNFQKKRKLFEQSIQQPQLSQTQQILAIGNRKKRKSLLSDTRKSGKSSLK